MDFSQNTLGLLESFGTYCSRFYEGDSLLSFVKAWCCFSEQSKQDFNELVQNTFRESCNVTHKICYYPITIKEEELNTTSEYQHNIGGTGVFQDNSWYFGVGASNLYYFPVANTITDFIAIADTLDNPDFFHYKNHGVSISNGSIIFTSNPFSCNSITINSKIINNVEHRSIDLILLSVEENTQQLQNSYGKAVALTNLDSTEYAKVLINKYWDCLTSGSTQLSIMEFIGAVLHVPIANKTEEVIDTGFNGEDEIFLLTATQVYKASRKTKFTKHVGETIYLGDSLTTALKTINLDIEDELGGIVVDPGYTNGITAYSITFPNNPNAVLSTSNDHKTFPILGDKADIAALWNAYYANCTTAGLDGNTILENSVVNGCINPMMFVYNNLLKHNHVFLKVNSDELDIPAKYLVKLNLLQQLNNPHVAVYIDIASSFNTDSITTMNLTDSSSPNQMLPFNDSGFNDIITLATGARSRTLEWTEVTGATGYIVEGSKDGINWFRIHTTPYITGNSYTDNGSDDLVTRYRVSVANVRGYNENYAYTDGTVTDTGDILISLIQKYPDKAWYVLQWNVEEGYGVNEFTTGTLGNEVIKQDNPNTIPIPANLTLTMGSTLSAYTTTERIYVTD